MSWKRRPNRHSFYGTAVADETRIEKRYNHVRQRRLSDFQENEGSLLQERGSGFNCKQDFIHWKFPSSQRKRSGSLPDPTLLSIMVTNTENETGVTSLSRPRSLPFDQTAKLYAAAAENDTSEIERILDSGKADPNHLYLSGVAPLHIAAAEGHLETIKILVRFGANVNNPDAEGCSPLEFALRGAHFDCASFLIKVGAETKKIVNGLN